MSTNISWIMLFHKILKTSPVDGYLYCQMELWAGRMDAVRRCDREGAAHKWTEIIMAYLEKSFFKHFLENGNTVCLPCPRADCRRQGRHHQYSLET